MNYSRIRSLLGTAVLSSVLSTPAISFAADTYPSKTVRLEVGFAPGGGTDLVARLLAQKLTESLGQSFVVENKSGATGMIAAKGVATAPADGYTLLMGHVNSQAIAPALTTKPPYDPIKDFSPVSYIGYSPNVLVINATTRANTVKELLALAKSKPDGLSFASPGVGSTNHLAGEMLRNETGLKMLHIPYRGSSPAIVDLLAGRIDMNFDVIASVVPYVKSGRTRALAVTGQKRDPDFPDVPTMAELGFKSFNITNWYGIFAPANTPAPVVEKLHAELERVLQLPDVQAQFEKLGVRSNLMSVEQFKRFHADEYAKYREIGKQTGIHLEVK